MLSSSETRRRKKDADRERSSPKSKERDADEKKERHRKSKSTRSSRKTSSITSSGERAEAENPHERPSKERIRSPSSTPQTPTKHRMAVVPEMERRGSLVGSLGSRNGSRSSLTAYPSLNKSYAKENIYARDDLGDRRKSPLTPEATDVGDDGDAKDKTHDSEKKHVHIAPTKAPPSPPLTATTGADLRKTASANSMRRKTTDTVRPGSEMERGRRSVDSGTRITRDAPGAGFGASRSSLREDDIEGYGTDLTSRTGSSHPSTVKQAASGDRSASLEPPTARPGRAADPRKPEHREQVPAGASAPRSRSRQASELTQTTDSDATSVAPGPEGTRPHRVLSPIQSDASPASVVDSSPLTPTQHSVLPSVVAAQKERPPTVEIFADPASRSHSVNPEHADTSFAPPPPPPPPPPPVLNSLAPRVDYLLLNGGLPRPVVRHPLAAVGGGEGVEYSSYTSPRPNEQLDMRARHLFRELQDVFDAYNTVLDRGGSLAMATGYYSVARRLLDRLEHVFARDISAEFCGCLMCVDNPNRHAHGNDTAGVNWGKVLEFVSGRLDLPHWPPIDNHSPTDALGISSLQTPCQEIDVDVPEEYRAQYARQSRKTKTLVQSWLHDQQDSAPDEVDNETLTFAMMTRLEPELRPMFHALLCGLGHVPSVVPQQLPTQTHGSPPLLNKSAIALQRLYRLTTRPRDQLVVMYLIRNPDMHDVLATIAAIRTHEWDLLVSGRFDGFITASDEFGPDGAPQSDTTGPAAPPTPFSSTSSRPGSTRPGPKPAPIQLDQETESAILSEVERNIYHTMDVLENVFEHMHIQAEAIRAKLRTRNSNILMAESARRGSSGIEVRIATPAADTDGDNLDDLRSDIGPDDSASNVSHNRRRAHRHRVRRTPAPVEEEPEEDFPSLAERVRRRF